MEHGARDVHTTSPRRIYVYAFGVAVVVAGVLIGLSQISAHRSTKGPASQPTPTASVPGAAETAALLQGIPQHGNVLGSPNAPVRLIEYADPQCPYCAQYALNVMPTLIRDYVRPGKVQLVFRGLWFLGQDSGTALATATAAGLQNRFWNVIDLLYRNQGPENAWVTDSLLRSIVTAAGANADRVFAARTSAGVNSTIRTWSTLAQNAGVNSVPNFFYGRQGGPLSSLSLSAIAVPEFRAALNGALKG
jgi:protein-disulfide isomerase